MNEPADLELEFLGPERAEEISAIAFPLFREVYADVPQDIVEAFLQKTQTPGAIREQMASGMEYAYIVSGGVSRGYVAFGIDGRGMYLSKFYLFPEYRRSGLGSLVIGFVERRAREAGAGMMHLDVNRKNYRAIRFYERHGFIKRKDLTFMRVEMTKTLRT